MTLSISNTFIQCRKTGKKALIPFLTSGFPSGKIFIKLMRTMSDAGADIIEVGIPFSDPLADGRTIQLSSQTALQKGVNIDMTFDYLSDLSSIKTPLVFMSYFNPIYHYGIERFIKKAYAHGIRGMIIPDLIPEEGQTVESICRDNNIELVYMLAPTTNGDRSEMILKRSCGFVYLVSIAGVTGARKELPKNLISWIKRTKLRTDLPICVGFGISNVRQARMISRAADGVIIGSAIIDKILSASSDAEIIKQTGNFILQLRKGINNE